MNQDLEIIYLDRPFHLVDFPIKNKIYVIDNYLETSLHHWINNKCTNSAMWSKTNQVKGHSKTGLPHHSFWGASFFQGRNGETHRDDNCVTELQSIPFRWFNRRICTDFGFKWKRFQYMGVNSQTYGQHGTTHADCREEDEWNISFLYYYNTYWNKEWGGNLRIYDEPQQGLDGRNEHIRNHEIGNIEFVPNRLLMFDGRLPHGADAPTERARYMDRRSIVLRGDEIELVNKEDFYNANDRFHYI